MRFLYLCTLVCSLAFFGCTNDEGDEDIDIITPNDEEEQLMS